MKLQTAKDRFDRLAGAFRNTAFDSLTADQLTELHAALVEVQNAFGAEGDEVERAIAE